MTPLSVADKSQERAKYAFAEVAKRTTNKTNEKSNESRLSMDEQKEFKSHIKDVPMMIRTNGLAAAFAFVFSKAKRDTSKQKRDYVAIEDITKNWLAKPEVMGLQPGAVFHETLISLDADNYRLCTREIMALYTWLKRYADGLIKETTDHENN